MNGNRRTIESQTCQTQAEDWDSLHIALFPRRHSFFICNPFQPLSILSMGTVRVNMLKHFTQAPHCTLLYIYFYMWDMTCSYNSQHRLSLYTLVGHSCASFNMHAYQLGGAIYLLNLCMLFAFLWVTPLHLVPKIESAFEVAYIFLE